MVKKILIIGGVAGGASAAARIRRLDEKATIIMFERGNNISFANCGLPYYIGDVIKERENLLLQTPESMGRRFNLDVRVQHEVKSIDRGNKTVTVHDIAKNKDYTESYDVLVIATGSSPVRPKSIPGIDAPNIFTLWNIPDTDAVKSYMDIHQPQRAVVVGSGFIGIEMAENLRELGLEVTLVDIADQIMPPIDFEMAQYLHRHLEGKGVILDLKDSVEHFVYENNVTTVVTKSGKA
ncbi:MAG: FAD-dependent oxidoreductase, partial [FCB group bacterium]|nr:FAD-dependent oxidoreductase [FCB group bacterium]